MEIRASTIINRPVDAVFAVLEDFEGWPAWEKSFLEVRKQVPEPIASKGPSYWARRKLPLEVESSFVVTEHVPNSRVMIEGDWIGSFKPAGGYLVEPVAEGTRVTSIARPELRGIRRLMSPLLRIMAKRQSEQHLRELKALVESKAQRSVGDR